MRSIAEEIAKSGLTDQSVLAFVSKFGSNSVRRSIAEHDIRDFHRLTYAKFGPLGAVAGALKLNADGSYTMDCQLGHIHLGEDHAYAS